jgi:hypothetical protein
MAEPVKIEIRLREGDWALIRNGRAVRRYGHVDEATHDAVRLARDLIHTGEPAEVWVDAGEGKMIRVDLTERRRAAQPGADEICAVVPDRGPSG